MKAIVTGTSRGIGIELARQLLSAGAQVHALARRPEASDQLQQLRRDHSDALQIHAVDVTSDESVECFKTTIRSESIDLLINNAGVYGENAEFPELDLNDVLSTFKTNTMGPMRVTKALLPNLLGAKAPKVVHITSLMGSIADNTGGGSYGYRISKAALNMFNKSFSVDFPGIISVVMHPGWVQTDMGGKEAPTPIPESARGILRVALNLKKSDTGKFFDFEGDIIPW